MLVFISYFGCQWLPSTIWLQTFSCSTETHTGLEQLEANFIF